MESIQLMKKGEERKRVQTLPILNKQGVNTISYRIDQNNFQMRIIKNENIIDSCKISGVRSK